MTHRKPQLKYSEDLVRVGRERLAVWRERAGQEADRAIADAAFLPGLASAIPEGLEEDDAMAVLVYQLPGGGWHCDILFSGAEGSGEASLGTPESQYLGSKRDAERAGFALLIGIIAILRRRRQNQAVQK